MTSPSARWLCENPRVDTDRRAVAELMASVAATVSRRAAAVSEDVYAVTRREIPELGDDQTVLALFASSIDSNVSTCLQIMQHQIDLAAVHAPAAALEEARRRAQRGTPLTALLRAYRLGHTVFLDWVFRELARQAHDDARMLTAVTMDLSKIVAGYVDQTSEEIVATYARERENWLRNRSAARAARIRDLLSGQLVDVSATEATLGYRLRQHHVGVVCWTGAETARVDNITRLERAIGHIAAQTAAGADPVFLPRDESSAWAWLPLGIRDRFDAAAAGAADLDGDLHVAFGDVAAGVAGFRLTHRQALAAQAVALAGGSPPRVVTYAEVAPVAMMFGSEDLLRAWVLSTLGGLADRRRAPRPAARDPARVPRHRRQLQDDGRTAGAAQELRPVPNPAGGGEPRPPGRRQPARRRTGPAGQPLARFVGAQITSRRSAGAHLRRGLTGRRRRRGAARRQQVVQAARDQEPDQPADVGAAERARQRP